MDNNVKRNRLEQLADLFRALALAPEGDRAAIKRGVTENDWQDMETIANFAGMFAGIESDISLQRGELGELVRSMINLQDRALETAFIDIGG